MMLRVRGSGATATIPTSSMADIAFLLLVFFLVTTVFDEEKGLPLVLPTSEVVDVSPNNVIHFLVGRDGVVEVRRGETAYSQFLRPEQVDEIWRFEAASNPRLIASVRTDPDAPYGNMIRVLDALQGAGAERISLQMRQ